MFKCGEKCTGILAADARLVREKVCYREAAKEKDQRGMQRAAAKIKDTQKYIKLMEDWPIAVNLAIGPALLIANIKSPKIQGAIKKQVEQVHDTGINPRTGQKLDVCGVTGPVIEYLIAKCNHRPFILSKWIRLTPDNINAIKYALVVCKENQNTIRFLKSLLEEK